MKSTFRKKSPAGMIHRSGKKVKEIVGLANEFRVAACERVGTMSGVSWVFILQKERHRLAQVQNAT